MTKEEVQRFLIDFFKGVGAVDRNLSDEEIARIKLTDLSWFDQLLDLDPDFKKEALFDLVVRAFERIFDGCEPAIVPFDGGVFDREIAISELAKEIADNT